MLGRFENAIPILNIHLFKNAQNMENNKINFDRF